MTGWAWIFLVLFFSTATVLFFMTRRALYLHETLDGLLDELMKTYQVLTVVHNNIQHKSKLEVFSDEPVVKDLFDDINAAKNTVFVTLDLTRSFLEDQGHELLPKNEENDQN
jgi:hypothetical protein